MGLLAVPSFAHADDLVVSARIEPIMDPWQQWATPVVGIQQHYMGYLTATDRFGQPGPALATSYEQLDGLWRFKLREGITFDDGSPFSAADVVASLNRARSSDASISGFSGIFAGVTDIVAVDDHTVEIRTSRPMPTLPVGLSQVAIAPARIAESASRADFNNAESNVGIGPFSFVEYVPGNVLRLKRNESYYGPKPEWENLTFRILPDASARVAALLGGDVDIIEAVPASQIDVIKSNPDLQVVTGPSDRSVFFFVDSVRDVTPFVKGPNGEALTDNPLKDVRVREALSIAIDRNAIRDRLMGGLSQPSGQIVPEGFGGYAENIPVPAYDPERARQLLAEAGWKDGFTLTMHCWDLYAQQCQGVPPMLTRIGVKTELTILPRAAYWPQMTDRNGERGSFFAMSWGATSGGEANVLETVIHTWDSDKDLGAWNLTGYSNPEIDALVEKAMSEPDAPARHAMQAKAMEMTMEDMAVVPFHVLPVITAARADLEFETFANENVYAAFVKKKRSE